MGLSTAADTVFRTDGFDLGEFMPDTLFNAVSVGTNTAVINAVIVSLVCIAIFMTLTVKVFDRSDVK